VVQQGGCCYAEDVLAEFKRDVIAVAHRGELTVAEVAVDFDVSEESVPRWVSRPTSTRGRCRT
jgi:transposase-like protein